MSAAASALPLPRAILVVSAHWETDVPTIGCAEHLETIHDFWGFPPALYDMRYAAQGNLAMAEEVSRLLRQDGLSPRLDKSRGLDHGSWIPLRQMFPAANIPVIPLSLQPGLGPQHHLRLGRALAPLLEQGVLLLASGNLTHNLTDFRTAAPGANGNPSYVGEFADWIWAHLAEGNSTALLNYRHLAPYAARAHPSEEHILPLFVALGAAGLSYTAERLYSGIADHVLAMDMFAFRPALAHPTHVKEVQQ